MTTYAGMKYFLKVMHYYNRLGYDGHLVLRRPITMASVTESRLIETGRHHYHGASSQLSFPS